MARRKSTKNAVFGGSDVGKQKCIRIVVGGVHHETTIKYIVASPIIAGARRATKYSGRPLKSVLTTITTEDDTVTATDEIAIINQVENIQLHDYHYGSFYGVVVMPSHMKSLEKNVQKVRHNWKVLRHCGGVYIKWKQYWIPGIRCTSTLTDAYRKTTRS